MDNIIIYALIALMVITIIYLGVRTEIKRKTYNPSYERQLVTLEFKDLKEALGGSDNIISVGANGSKVEVALRNTKIVRGDKLKELGASGVVVSNGTCKMIFGHASPEIAEMFNKYLKKN